MSHQQGIAFDLSVLGLASIYQRHRTGVCRYVHELSSRLCLDPTLDMRFVASGRAAWNDLAVEASLASILPNAVANYQPRRSIVPGLRVPLGWYGKAAMRCGKLKKLPPEFVAGMMKPAGCLLGDLRVSPSVGLYHSPAHALPAMPAKVQRLLTVLDLIPLRFPQWYEDPMPFRRILSSLDPTRDFALCISECTRNDLVEHTKFPIERTFVVPLAPSAEFSPMAEESAKAELSKLGIERPFILSVATLEPRKNLPALVEAFGQLQKDAEGREVDLVLTGPRGWLNEPLDKALARANMPEGRIRWTGFVGDQQLRALYSQCQAFAFPSLYEGFGLPPLEAMACGARVVCLSTSSLPEVIGSFGHLAADASPEAIAEALKAAIAAGRPAGAERTAILDHAAGYSWEQTALGTKNVYREILARA